jgi:hypothetical protein
VIIDSVAETPRYRSWRKPRAIAEKPDLEIARGVQESEGTTPCAHSIWTFRNGDTSYTVSELGCSEGDPDGRARGELTVQTPKGGELTWWCY